MDRHTLLNPVNAHVSSRTMLKVTSLLIWKASFVPVKMQRQEAEEGNTISSYRRTYNNHSSQTNIGLASLASSHPQWPKKYWIPVCLFHPSSSSRNNNFPEIPNSGILNRIEMQLTFVECVQNQRRVVLSLSLFLAPHHPMQDNGLNPYRLAWLWFTTSGSELLHCSIVDGATSYCEVIPSL